MDMKEVIMQLISAQLRGGKCSNNNESTTYLLGCIDSFQSCIGSQRNRINAQRARRFPRKCMSLVSSFPVIGTLRIRNHGDTKGMEIELFAIS